MKKRKKLKITPMKIDKEVKDEKPELMMLFEKMKRKKVAIETEKDESRKKKIANDEKKVLSDEKKPSKNVIDENITIKTIEIKSEIEPTNKLRKRKKEMIKN